MQRVAIVCACVFACVTTYTCGILGVRGNASRTTKGTDMNACKRCTRKFHTQCARTLPCECRDAGHVAPRNESTRHDAAVWSDTDARTMLGTSGARASLDSDGRYRVYGYAWGTRCNHMHYARPAVTDRIARHGKVRLTWPTRYVARTQDVYATGHATDRSAYRRARAYGRAFDRARSDRSEYAAPSALPCVQRARDTRVTLSARTTDTLARGNVWGARNTDTDTWARAFDARIAARECGCGNATGCVGYGAHVA